MESRAKNIYRTAVCIVGRIRHELIIESEMDVLRYLDIVIGFDHFFERVMRQFPITDQRPQTSCREKSAMGGADSVYNTSDTYSITVSVPGIAFDLQPSRNAIVNISVLPDLALPVAPTRAYESTDVFADGLFDVEREPVLISVASSFRDVLHKCRISERFTIATHVGAF